MASFAHAAAGRPGVAEVLYTPVGGWYPGAGWTRLGGTLARDHYSHVHVGVRGDGAVGTTGGGPMMGDGRIGDGAEDAAPLKGLGPPPRGFKDPGRKKREKSSAYRERVLEARKAYLDEWRTKLENRARKLSDDANRKITVDARDSELEARGIERQAEAKEAQAERTRDPKQANKLRNEARALRARAVGVREASLRRQGKLYSGLAGALRGVAGQATAHGLPTLARELSQQAADAAYEARARGSDADDRQAEATELSIPEPEPEETPVGAGDEGGGGGYFGEELGADVAAAPPPLTAEQIEGQLRAVREHRSRFFSSFAPDVFTPTAAGLAFGSSPLATGAGYSRPGVTIVQQFTQPPDDPYVYIRKGYIAAQAAVT
jgi:hypothetical protein